MLSRRILGQVTLFTAILTTALISNRASAQTEGLVRAWGDNSRGQAQYPNWGGVKAVAAGRFHTLVVRYDNTVQGWGLNTYGECTPPAGLTDVVALAAGSEISTALKSDGTIVQWGYSDQWTTPKPAGLNNVTAIACGVMHRLALKADGTVAAWGYTNSGQCDVPADLTGVVAIAAGSYHSVALKSDGTVVAWGYNTSGQCNVPPGLTGVKAIAAGNTHTLALMSNGSIVAWGDNTWGSLNVPNITGVKAICAEWDCNLAIKADGTVAYWGLYAYGLPNVPAEIKNAKGIACGFEHCVVLYDQNSAPTANAGGNQTVYAAHSGNPYNDVAQVTLNGAGSSDPEGSALTYLWTDAGNAVLGTDATLIESLSVGLTTYNLTVTDPYGATGTDQATITVLPALNGAPTANAGTDQTVSVTHNGNPDANTGSFTLHGSFSDPEGDDVVVRWKDENGAVISNSLQPTFDRPAGSYTFTLLVIDTYGEFAQDTVTVTVSPEQNGAPVLTAPATATGNIGTLMTIATSATDPDGDRLTYSLTSAPGGAGINASTGLVSWTPSAAGTYAMTVRAADAYGASDSKTISVTVSPIVIEHFAATRSKQNVVTVTMDVRNSGTAQVTGISLSSATLKGFNTTTVMPLSIGTLKAGVSKKGVKLTFAGASVPAGAATLVINGTSSAGSVKGSATLNVP